MSVEVKDFEKLRATWGEGNIPFSESLDFEEQMIDELQIRRCRSFRADLVHKLNMIARGAGSWQEAARELRVTAMMVREWRHWNRVPGGRDTFMRIDACYEVAIERLKLRAQKTKQLSDAAKLRLTTQ